MAHNLVGITLINNHNFFSFKYSMFALEIYQLWDVFFYFLSFFSMFIDVKFSNKFHSHRTGKDVIKYLHIEEIKKEQMNNWSLTMNL